MKTFAFVSILFYALYGHQVIASESTFETDTTICKTQYGTTQADLNQKTTVWNSYNSHTTATRTLTTTPITKITDEAATWTVVEDAREIITQTRSVPYNKIHTIMSTITNVQTITAPVSVVTDTFVTTTTINITSTSQYSAASITPVFETLQNAASKRSRIYGRQRSSKNPAAILGLASTKGLSASVTCSAINYKVIIVQVQKTAPAKTITVHPSAIRKTVTSTQTGTSTVFWPRPKSSVTSFTTITSFTTTTPVITSTLTSTTTSTIVAVIETVYPQCGSSNFAKSVLNVPIFSAVPVGDFWVDFTDAPTSTQCCINCLLDPKCAATLFGQGSLGSPKCLFFSRGDGVCDAANPLKMTAITDKTFEGEAIRGIGNGKCGIYDPLEAR